jgi:hypothetical protein
VSSNHNLNLLYIVFLLYPNFITSLQINATGKEGEINLSHSKHIKCWCDNEMPCWWGLESCFRRQSGSYVPVPSWCIPVAFMILLFVPTLYTMYLLQIQDVLQRATVDSKSQVGSIFQVLNTKESPPTYFQTNKFTSAFQEIVDAYGYVSLFWPLQPILVWIRFCSAVDLASLAIYWPAIKSLNAIFLLNLIIVFILWSVMTKIFDVALLNTFYLSWTWMSKYKS